MATGENFMRIHWAKKQNSEINSRIKAEIALLQKMDTALWDDDTLDDEFVEQESKKLNARIQQLINAN